MRAVFIIALVLLASIAFGQISEIKLFTLEEALKKGLLDNPTAVTPADRKNLSTAIKSEWFLWLYRIMKWQTLQEYERSLDQLDRIAALRFHAGDIDFKETSSLLRTRADMESTAYIAENEMEISRNRIRQLLYSYDSIAPADTSIAIYQINKEFSSGTPAIVPVDSVTQLYQDFSHDLTIENRHIELDNLFFRLQVYKTSELPHSETIILTAKAMLKAEEIDYLEYAAYISEAYRIRLSYLEVWNNYNQSAIQLENYAY